MRTIPVKHLTQSKSLPSSSWCIFLFSFIHLAPIVGLLFILDYRYTEKGKMGRDEESKKKTFLDRLIERNKITTNWNGVLFSVYSVIIHKVLYPHTLFSFIFLFFCRRKYSTFSMLIFSYKFIFVALFCSSFFFVLCVKLHKKKTPVAVASCGIYALRGDRAQYAPCTMLSLIITVGSI